ncbi:hypothetical protein HAX54_047573 [Datura stramonium]|uniref:Uncharacterized protein n=1 Tax=Datura stramonium TaxID=4076 RepID=A0ABS8ST11_DATST|nr:hypothetical protein [Datura stramonium]
MVWAMGRKFLFGKPLKMIYPEIFTINQQQKATIHEVWYIQGTVVPTRQLFVEMQRDRSLEQQNADAYDCSNFVDLDWLSSLQNSCEEELLDRVFVHKLPIGGLSSEYSISDIVGKQPLCQ